MVWRENILDVGIDQKRMLLSQAEVHFSQTMMGSLTIDQTSYKNTINDGKCFKSWF